MIRIKLKGPDVIKMSKKITDNLVNSKMIDDLNNEVITEIKRFMASGTSPVRGKRRFEAYKDKDKYPGERKPSRPVNLKLSGDLYDAYKAFKKSMSSFYLGISSLASEKIKIYAKANNLGENNIPERRFVPIEGEQYNVSVMRKIKDIISKRIAEIFKSK